MKLNHLSLVVPDVAATSAFFEKHFNFRCTGIKGDHAIAVLLGDDDFILVLSKPRKNETQCSYPQDFHVGFMLDTEQEVQEVFRKLQEDRLAQEAPKKIRNTISFYFIAPGGFMMEVGCPVNA